MARGGFFAVDSLSSVHVLVVDDDAPFRDVLISLLRYCGALVIGVATVEEALLTMDQVRPDAVVVAMTSPRSAAASLPRRLRARKPEAGGNVPIVAVMRGPAPHDAPEGTNAQLSEPLDPWELCRVISAVVTIG